MFMEPELLQSLTNKLISKIQLCPIVAENFDLLSQVLNSVSFSKVAIRYGCRKALMDLSANFENSSYFTVQ
jgi:hypothetical protein